MAEETMLEYVQRKLKDDAYNRAELCRRTGLKKAAISHIQTGRVTDPQFSTVQILYKYFHELAK